MNKRQRKKAYKKIERLLERMESYGGLPMFLPHKFFQKIKQLNPLPGPQAIIYTLDDPKEKTDD